MPIPSRSYSRVLVPLDGSITAEFALPYAVDLANKHHAELHLLYIIETPSTPVDNVADHPHSPEENLASYLAALRKEIRETGVHVQEHTVAHQDPGKALLDFVDVELISVVVLATQGHQPMLSWLFGDQIEERLSQVVVPFMLVRPQYDQVVVPLDGSKWAEAAIGRARQLTQLHGAELILLHVYQPKGSDYADQWALAGQQQIADQNYEQLHDKLIALRNRLRQEGLRAREVMVRGGTPAQAIADYVENEEDICIIVMSTHGRTGLSKLLAGSVAQNVIKQTRVPVILVNPEQS